MIPSRARLHPTLLALVAALAMLVQAMVAPAAMAAPAGHTIQVCAEHGLKTISVPDAPGKQTPAPCPHCDHCLAPAAVAVANQTASVEPALYAVEITTQLAAPALSPYAARAPPRPPSQAPPLS